MRIYADTVLGIAAGVVSLLALPAGAAAQTIGKPSLSLDGARRVIAAAEAYARAHHAPGGVIAVVDDGGHLVALERLDGTFAAAANISIGKARTAALFKKPTRFFEDVIRNGRTPMVALNDFVPLQGGVPITIDGRIVGAVGVSGAASAQQDEDLAMAGAAAVEKPGAEAAGDGGANADEGPRQAATHLDHASVAAALAKGGTLYGGVAASGDPVCTVNASRRDGPGQAEVHAREADVMYIVAGTATLVTGGTLVDPVADGTDEARGAAIAGGQAAALSPGDVVIVPPGVPHWFREVPTSLEYLVVKVRRPGAPTPAPGAAATPPAATAATTR